MRPRENTEKIIKKFNLDINPERDHEILDELRQAQAASKQPKPETHAIEIWRIIMKNKTTKFAAAAAVILIGILIVNQFGGSIDGTSVAFAKIQKAVHQMHLMHKLLNTNIDGHQHSTENWYCFDSKSVLSKHTADGKLYKISSLDYDTMENVVYDPDSNIIKVLYRVDVSTGSLHSSPWVVLEDYIKDYERQGASITRKRKLFEGEDVDVYYLTVPSNFRKEREETELFVNRSSHLPVLYKRKFWAPEGKLRFDQVIRFDFPENGPTDIYDLGVSRTTEVVHDLESRERLDRVRELQEEKAAYDEPFKEIYRLEKGEVLRRIPLPESRLKLDEISNAISILKREGSLLLPPMSLSEKEQMIERNYYMYRWDGNIARKDDAISMDGVTLKTVLDRMIYLSKFQYDNIPEELASINIPGDWVIRNNTPKEQLLMAFEDILQSFTDNPIRFEKRQVERDVIAVRGKFHFKPLTGTYDDSWIHVFSDKMDTDERGGGGAYSLDRFLTQRLAETQLEQQVVNLTELSDDIRIKFGCHTSAYLGEIEPGDERDANLDLLLENLSRQTSLVFTKERRKVDVWYVVGDF